MATRRPMMHSKGGPAVRGKNAGDSPSSQRGRSSLRRPVNAMQEQPSEQQLTEEKFKEGLEEFMKDLKQAADVAAEKNSMELKELKQAAESNSMELKGAIGQLIKQISDLEASLRISSPSSGVPPGTPTRTSTSPPKKSKKKKAGVNGDLAAALANDAAVAAATEEMNDAMSTVARAALDGSNVVACLNALVGTLKLLESVPVLGALAATAANFGKFVASTFEKHADARAILPVLLNAISYVGLLGGVLNECRDDGDKANAETLVNGVSTSMKALLAELVAYTGEGYFEAFCSALTNKPDRILKAAGAVKLKLVDLRDWVSALGQKNTLLLLKGLAEVPDVRLPLAQAAVDMRGRSTPGSAAEAEALVEVGLAGGVSFEDLSAGMAELGCSNARAEEALAGYGEALAVQLEELMRVNQGLVEGQLEVMGKLRKLEEKQEVAIGKIDDLHEDQKEGQLEMMDKIKDMKGDQKAMYEGMLAAIEKQSRVLEGQVKEQTRVLAEQLKLENTKDASQAAENTSLKEQLRQKEVDLAAIAAAAASVRGGDAKAAAASLAASGASAEVKESFEAVLAQAAAAQDAKDYVKGAELFGKACKMDPSSPSAWFGSGFCLYETGDKAGAEASFRKAIELDPKNAPVHYNLGNVLQAMGNLTGAEEYYRKALELDPKHADAHCNLGGLLQDKGNLAGAEECYRKAIELDPKNANTHLRLGLVLMDTGDKAGAEECYRKAIELDPKDANAHGILGNLLLDKGDKAGAEASCCKAIELDPKIVIAHGNLGALLKDKADALEASGGDGKAVAALLLEAAKHWEVGYGADKSFVVAAREKAAKLK